MKSRKALGDELAVLVEIFDALGDDAWRRRHRHRSSAASRRRGGIVQVRLAIDDGFVRRRASSGIGSPSSSVGGTSSGGAIGIALARLVNLHRLAVEVRIGEMAGRAAEVDQREVELLGVLVDAGAAPDDLLELGHRADLAVEHDQAAGLRIDAGREQPRGGDEHGVLRFRVDEVAELVLAFVVAAGDAHDVAVVLGDTDRRSR